MDEDEILSWIDDYEESMRIAKKYYQAFNIKLTKELTELVFKFSPKMDEKRNEIETQVCEISEKYMKEVINCFDRFSSYFYDKIPITGELSVVPKPKTREDAEKQLTEELKEIPKEHHELYAKYHWEDYEHDKQHEDFLFATFNKMKEVLVEIYFESIVDFDSDYLRRLDYAIYLMCAGRFVQEVYELEM